MSAVTAYASAAAAYQRATRQLTEGDGAEDAAATAPAAGSAFAGMVKEALAGAVASGKASEAQSAKALEGGADLGQVITAVAEAEVALQSVVAIRDKMIEAYKDIMRMPI